MGTNKRALSHLNNEDFDEQFSLVLEVKTFIENKMKFKIVQLRNNNDSINEDVQVDDINVEETVVPKQPRRKGKEEELRLLSLNIRSFRFISLLKIIFYKFVCICIYFNK